MESEQGKARARRPDRFLGRDGVVTPGQVPRVRSRRVKRDHTGQADQERVRRPAKDGFAPVIDDGCDGFSRF